MFFSGQNLTPQVGCEQGHILAKRERNEFKPVVFNQGSAQVLGVKVYGLKRQ